MSLLRAMAKLSTRGPYREFLRAMEAVDETQAEVWRETQGVLNQSPFWREHFQGRVPARLVDYPITDYGTYASALERGFHDRLSPLSGEPVILWGTSSGTSGNMKTLPITERYRRQFQRVNQPYVHGLLRRFPGFLDAPVLYMTATIELNATRAGAPVGFISAFNYLHTPGVLTRRLALPKSLMTDGAALARATPVYAAATDLSAIFCITPSRLRALLDELHERREEILTEASRLPGVSRARLDRVRQVISQKNFLARELWPSLRFVGCWKTSICGLQLKGLQDALAGVPVVDAMYSATEGWVNVPLETHTNGGPIHPGGVIVEFIEEGQAIEPGNLRGPRALEAGKRYEIFLTNLMGLVRYRLADIVLCTGFRAQSPIIEFAEKAGGQFNVRMYWLNETQILEGIDRAGLSNRTLFVTENEDANGLVLVHPDDQTIASGESAALDRAWSELSAKYQGERKLGMIRPLEIKSLPRSHPAWAPAAHAQAKVPLLRARAQAYGGGS